MAQFNLGGLYVLAQGVPHDPIRAGVWFTPAAIAGCPGACRNRNAVASVFNPLEQARVEKMVRDCVRERYLNGE